MALRWHDNFETWTVMPGKFTTNADASISSGKLLVNGTVLYAQLTLDAQSTWIVNTRISFGITPTGNAGVILFHDDSTLQCSLGLKANGKLAFFRGNVNGGNQLGSDSTVTLAPDSAAYHDLEIKVVIHNSTGSVVVKLNGETIISATNVNTRAGANNSANILRFGDTAGSSSISWRYDHLIIMDGTGASLNDFIGPVQVNTHYPTADGNYTGWTANTGNRWAAVDDTAPNGDTDYVAASAVGSKVSFTKAAVPAGVTTVHGVGVWLYQERDDATTRADKVLLRNSGSDQLGTTEFFLSPSYAYHYQPFAQSPFTSSAWGVSEWDNTEIGAQVTT